jgi:cytochrome c oxidase assembly protein subunit 15
MGGIRLSPATYRLSPAAYRRITLLALLAVSVIIVTGGVVRLTGSGLGCPDWPTCARHTVVAARGYHRDIEQWNRWFTGVVSAAVILAVLGSWARQPRRRDLTWLSGSLVVGVLCQIVLGGLTVLFKLRPPFVMGHFLLSMAILAAATVLHHRAGQPDTAPVPIVDRDLLHLGRLLLGACAIAIFLGTVVTSTGPHGGDPNAERLPFALHDVARLHGTAVMLFLLITVTALVMLVRAGAPRHVLRAAEVLLVVLVAQAAVGYVQYFTGVPVLLVGIHIAGAAAVWVATIRLNLVLVHRPVDIPRAAVAEPLAAARAW